MYRLHKLVCWQVLAMSAWIVVQAELASLLLENQSFLYKKALSVLLRTTLILHRSSSCQMQCSRCHDRPLSSFTASHSSFWQWATRRVSLLQRARSASAEVPTSWARPCGPRATQSCCHCWSHTGQLARLSMPLTAMGMGRIWLRYASCILQYACLLCVSLAYLGSCR